MTLMRLFISLLWLTSFQVYKTQRLITPLMSKARNVMEACRNGNVGRVVYSASGSCYGVAKNYPTPETDEISPEYPYALTKFLGEQIVMHWSKVYNIHAISLRFLMYMDPDHEHLEHMERCSAFLYRSYQAYH